eukprot:6895265-Prymnesium_polylepis.2
MSTARGNTPVGGTELPKRGGRAVAAHLVRLDRVVLADDVLDQDPCVHLLVIAEQHRDLSRGACPRLVNAHDAGAQCGHAAVWGVGSYLPLLLLNLRPESARAGGRIFACGTQRGGTRWPRGCTPVDEHFQLHLALVAIEFAREHGSCSPSALRARERLGFVL